jgi:hypothetical protein
MINPAPLAEVQRYAHLPITGPIHPPAQSEEKHKRLLPHRVRLDAALHGEAGSVLAAEPEVALRDGREEGVDLQEDLEGEGGELAGVR